MSKGPGNKKKDPDFTKQYSSGHIPLAAAKSDFLREIYTNEKKTREVFANTSHLLKKSRNPCVGDLTSREDADYLLPFSSTFQNTLEEAKFEDMLAKKKESPNKVQAKFIADIDKVDALRRRKEVIENEMKQLEKLMTYKKLALAIGSGELAVKTLHPALQQVSKISSVNFNK